MALDDNRRSKVTVVLDGMEMGPRDQNQSL